MNKEYVSNPSTLCGAEKIIFADGKAKGVEAYRMYNGKLDAIVIADRAMDIYKLQYKGTPISFVSKNGLVSPNIAGSESCGFLNSFDAGFLYTCGLDNVGAPEDGKPMHGSLSYIPAQNVHIETEETAGEYYVTLKGEVRFTALFGSNLVLKREIRMAYLSDEITINDKITNEAFTDSEYLLLYHINIGYPLLSEKAKLYVDSTEVVPASAVYDLDRRFDFEAPTAGRPEETYLYTLTSGKGIKAKLENDTLGMEMIVDPKEFPYIFEWKSMASGDYALGIEPTTTPMPKKVPKTLRPGETATHSVTWKFYEK